MAEDYQDFDLRIRGDGAGYVVSCTSPVGAGSGAAFANPFQAGYLEEFRARRGSGLRDLDPQVDLVYQKVSDVGVRLFEAVFSGKIRRFWDTSFERARQSRQGLRLRIFCESPELWEWPWEFLCDPDRDFLIFNRWISIVRCPEVSGRMPPPRSDLPVRIVVAIARPRGDQPLDCEGEWQELERSLAGLERRIELVRVDPASLTALREKLGSSPHILHFIGHGGFDPEEELGILRLAMQDGEPDPVTGLELVRLLGIQPLPALVVLNTCEGGRAIRSNPFAGVAQALVKAGVPAVVAMQSKVSDEAAILFAKSLYKALAEGKLIDRAVYEARHALFSARSTEWESPVLYLQRGFRIAPPKPSGLRSGIIAAAAFAAFVLIYGLLPARLFVTSDLGCPSLPGLDMPFAWVPSGSVAIGDIKESTSRDVRIDKSYCMGKFEVTQQQWKALMPKNPSRHKGTGRLPVEKVSLDDAQRFVRRLNDIYPAGHCRIPSEAEWMRAAAAGGGSPAPEEMSSFGNCDRGDGYDKTASVGSFKPNGLGVYDLYGNVSEWVDELYEPPSGGPRNEVVHLGGSFNTSPKTCSTAYRTHSEPGRHAEDIGFRVVCDVVP
ncbi:MAG: hypothetical protein QOF89_5062 [Acidobacteriota bacterium]|jgi:formylglycine-generating enzyme required for sulfatase activity|nr:hypothetical protein [Acidobacteriota bacterium]